MNTTVLLVEARDDCRTVYAEALRAAGLDVIAVSDSHAALDAAPNARPRIIVTSFDSATRDDCLNLCSQLKGDRRTQTTPMVLVSAKVNDEDVKRATELGCLAVAVTPLDGAKLVAAIRGVLAAAERPEPPRASLKRPDDISKVG